LFSEVTKRPFLFASLTAQDFASWYWLKEELVAFCREHQISPSGSKLQLQSRITDDLSGKNPVRPPSPQHTSTKMPTHFTMDTVIGEGWRCNPSLGAFFKQTLGPGFHFNAPTRDFIHTKPGSSRQQAIDAWWIKRGKRKAPTDPPPHTR
jgi:hypothetical protein